MSAAVDRLVDRLRGSSGRAWAGSVDDLLYEGEEVDSTVEMGDNRVVVTSHRVLALMPDSSGENFRGVDLPNVSNVRAGYEGERNLLVQGGRFLLYGALLLGIGLFVDFSSFVPTDAFGSETTSAAGRIGVGSMFSSMNRFLGLVAQLDRYALIVGALLLAFAVFVFLVYLLTRDRVLVIDVAGEESDIHVPAPPETIARAVEELEVELFDAVSAEAASTEHASTPASAGRSGESADDLLDGTGGDSRDAVEDGGTQG